MKKKLLFLLFVIVFVHACQAQTPTDTPPEPSVLPPTSTPVPDNRPPDSSLEPSLMMTLGTGVISEYAYSPDGTTIVMADRNTLRWYDAESFEELGAMDLVLNMITGFDFSPNSQLVAIMGYFSAVVVDLNNRSLIAEIKGSSFNGIRCVRFLADNQQAVYLDMDSSTGGPYYNIGLWNIAEDHFEHSFPIAHEDRYHSVTCPVLDPTGTWVAAGYEDSTEQLVYIWDVQSGETIYAMEGHAARVCSVDVSPDGKFLASASYDGTVRLWDPQTGAMLRVITGFLDDVFDVEFSDDGRYFHVGVRDHPAKKFDMLTGTLSEINEDESQPDSFQTFMQQQGYSTGRFSSSSVLFSPDGKMLAVGSETVLLWNVSTGELIRSLQGSNGKRIDEMAFGPDGNKLAANLDHAGLIVWDTTTGDMIFELLVQSVDGEQVIYADNASNVEIGSGNHVSWEYGIAISPDGRHIAIGNGVSVEIWDIHNAELVASMEKSSLSSHATSVSYSPDGKKLYTIFEHNRGAAIWEAESGRLLKEIDSEPNNPHVFSETDLLGPLFVRNNADSGQDWIEIWDLDQEQFVSLEVPSYMNQPLRFSPDGEMLISLDDDWLYFWDIARGQLIHTEGTDIRSADIAIHPNSQMMAVGIEGIAELWDISAISSYAHDPDFIPATPPPTPIPSCSDYPTATPHPTLMVTPMKLPELSSEAIAPSNARYLIELSSLGKGTLEDAIWSPDSSTIVVSGSEGVHTYDSIKLYETNAFDPGMWMFDTVYTPDRRLLAAGSFEEQIQVWDVLNNELLFEQQGWGDPAISPDGDLVVFLDDDNNLLTWEIDSGEMIAKLFSDYSTEMPVFSPDSGFVAAILSLDYVRVWDARTGEIINAVGVLDSPITSLAFSRDGQFLVAPSSGSAWVWHVQPGFKPYSIDLFEGVIDGNLTLYENKVTAAALSPDNCILALSTTGRTIQLYDRLSGNLIRNLEGHANVVEKLRFSPGGGRLLSIDRDGVMMSWDVATGQQLVVNREHLGQIGGLEFNSDGNLAFWQENTAWVIHPDYTSLEHSTIMDKGTILAASPSGDWLAVYEPYQVSLMDADSGELGIRLEGEAEDVSVHYRLEGDVERRFYGAVFSRDGSRLVTFGSGGTWIYDVQDGELLKHYEGSNSQKASISPDNRIIIASLYEQFDPPALWDIQADEALYLPYGWGERYLNYAFSPDGLFIGVVKHSWYEDPQGFVLLDTSSGLIEGSYLIEYKLLAEGLAFSPDARLVAIGQTNGTILILNIDTFEVITKLSGHKETIKHLAFSGDGRYLASAGIDGTVRIWGLP